MPVGYGRLPVHAEFECRSRAEFLHADLLEADALQAGTIKRSETAAQEYRHDINMRQRRLRVRFCRAIVQRLAPKWGNSICIFSVGAGSVRLLETAGILESKFDNGVEVHAFCGIRIRFDLLAGTVV